MMEKEKFKCMYSYDSETGDLKAYAIYWKGKFVGEITLDGRLFKREIKVVPDELLKRVGVEMEDIRNECAEERLPAPKEDKK